MHEFHHGKSVVCVALVSLYALLTMSTHAPDEMAD